MWWKTKKWESPIILYHSLSPIPNTLIVVYVYVSRINVHVGGKSIYFWSPRNIMEAPCIPRYLNTGYLTRYRSNLSWYTMTKSKPEESKVRDIGLIGELEQKVVYYEWMKWDLQIRPVCECRCDERLHTKVEESTRLGHTGLFGELEHLKMRTRLTNRREVSECDWWTCVLEVMDVS